MANSSRIDLNDLLLLMQVVDKGGFSAVSRALGIPKSTVSQRVAALERAAGTGLLRRTSRSHSLTAAGERLLPFARAISRQARELEHELLRKGTEATGTLRISTSVAIAQFALGPMLPRFLREHPGVTVRVDATNRYADLIGEGYDLGLRAHNGPLRDSTLRQRVVARTPWSLAAAPEWLARHGKPKSPAELAKLETLYFKISQNEEAWTLRKEGVTLTARLKPALASDDMGMLRAAAEGGAGVVALPAYILRPAIEAGRLELVLPGWGLLVSSISVLLPPKEQSSRLAKLFSNYLSANLLRSLGE